MEKVIFDTNFIRNPDPKRFLGGRSELEKFSNVADLIFPDIVIEEVKNQKRRNLEKQKNSFLSNPFHWISKLDDDNTKKINIESLIAELEDNEPLEYSVIKLSDYSVLDQIKELALKKLPPFDSGDNTDKGFKDACIYFTTLQYLQSIPDKMVFMCCKDGRLKEAFKKHPNVIVIEGFDEFIQNSITVLYDDYFIEKLKSEINEGVTRESIIDYWVNINDNYVLLIEVEGITTAVEVDSGEIVAYASTDDYSGSISSFIKSGAFSTTHSAVGTLNPYVQFLSDDEITKILEAACANEQIHWIMDDDDVKQFISMLYEKKKGILSAEIYGYIKCKLEG